ncbi:TniQ family protein, partial [Bacillus cereus]|nr:TniQ family protein [Bacillus cereus]
MKKSLNELEDSTNQRRFSDRVNKIAAHVVRYCPRCLKEDFESFGECYLHRLHQIDKLDICHRHHIQLICRCPICNSPL